MQLSSIIDFNDLWLSERLPKTSAGLLGKELGVWLNALLDHLKVGTEPLILGECSPAAHLSGRVYIAAGAVVEPGAMISGPTYIGPGTEVRHGAYIRGNVYVGKDCVVGHVTEVKGSCFFDGAKAGHFAYVGDSILGREVNLGAGTKIANLKIKGDEVFYRDPITDKKVGSGLRKLGAIIGDRAQTGCNSVLSPGSVLCPGTAVLPCVHHHGTLKSGWAR